VFRIFFYHQFDVFEVTIIKWGMLVKHTLSNTLFQS